VSVAHGVHGSGQRTFSAEQYNLVVAVIAGLRSGQTITVEEVASKTGVQGRAVREIISTADGHAFLLGGDGNGGYQLATYLEDAARITARLESQAKRMLERVNRRKIAAEELPINQPGLFD
jgi:hypothetical protein